MNSLGMYFGQKVIGIVEVKGKKVLNNIQIPLSALSASGLEDKVPEEIKIVAFIKDELRKNKVETRNATVTLSGTDLIIRTFEVPLLPAKELPGAIHFEVKKYIPFKIEDLVSDSQFQLDKTSHSYFVLFVGIKKETLERYFSILSQLGIKINSIEYSGFSIFRLMELSGFKEKGVLGVISIDVKEENETDFTVMENGIPLFSRDIKLSSRPQEISKTQEIPPAGIFDKLKTEIRISLDYYNHKFPTKKLEKFLLIGTLDSRADIEAFAQKLDLPFRFIESSRIAGLPESFSLSFLKAYSSALSDTIKTNVKINILSAWERARQLKVFQEHPKEMLPVLFSGFRLNSRVAVFAVLICIISFVFGMLQKLPVVKEINTIIASRPAIAGTDSQASYGELSKKAAQYNKTIIAMSDLLKKQVYLTPLLSALSRLLPEEMWLDGFSFVNTENKIQFTLRGMVYQEVRANELELIQNVLTLLKKDPYFSKYFKDISIVSADTSNFKNKTVTVFTITGTS